jgi:hypothetical protein
VSAPTDPSRDYKLAARVHSQVPSGNISRAIDCLELLPLAEVAQCVLQEMHNLLPYGAPPPHIAVEAPPLSRTEEEFDAVLENLGVGKAPGLTGGTYEHIKRLCSRRAGKQASRTPVHALLYGQLPPVFELLDCDSLPLLKPAGGIRPIAIGEAWIRLASLCTMLKCSDLGPSLALL